MINCKERGMYMMKRFVCFILAALLLMLCGCSTNVRSGSKVELIFVSESRELSIHQTLPSEEAEKVIAILNGRPYEPQVGTPSCGFDLNIAVSVNGRRYCVACDTCNSIYDAGAFQYFSVPKEDIQYIHALFEKYGGFFPCV